MEIVGDDDTTQPGGANTTTPMEELMESSEFSDEEDEFTQHGANITTLVSTISTKYLHQLCKNQDQLLSQLQTWGLIAKEVVCTECGSSMILKKDVNNLQKSQWRCSNKHHFSIKKGTFFEASHLTIEDILNFIYFWCMNLPLGLMQREVGIKSSKTTAYWNSFCSKVVARFCEKLPSQIDLGKRRNNVGLYVEVQLFRGVCRGFFLEVPSELYKPWGGTEVLKHLR